MDNDLRFLERLCNCTLVIFRSNEDKPRISIPKLLVAIVLLLLSMFSVSFQDNAKFSVKNTLLCNIYLRT
jgi:hypothetical protein